MVKTWKLIDICINIWSVKKEKIVKTHNGNDTIFEVCWNKGVNGAVNCFANKKFFLIVFVSQRFILLIIYH